jgi:hypothetical protein
LATQHSFIKGVVGWVPLKDPCADEILNRLAHHPNSRSVREVHIDGPAVEAMIEHILSESRVLSETEDDQQPRAVEGWEAGCGDP